MTPEESPLPDYYAILQVHPEADIDVIRAAYRQLMRKYHPDNLAIDQRQDMEILQRVRLINLAYDVLSDPTQREFYDVSLKQQVEKWSLLNTPGVETRIHLVRCSQSHNTYKMLLARRAGSGGVFRVTGFELIVETATRQLVRHQNEYPLELPDGRQKAGTLRNLLDRAFTKSKKQYPPITHEPQFPSQNELQDLFNTSTSLNFSEIDWAGFCCPACQAGFHLPDGRKSFWCYCFQCRRIHCAGNLHNTPLGVYGHCPWCGRLVRITQHIRPGEQVDTPVRGEVGRSEEKLPELKDAKQPQLPKQSGE